MTAAGTTPGEIWCAHCGRTAARPASGVPHGWYFLSVSVPAFLNAKGYIALGLFCTPECLAAEFPRIREQERLTRQAYEHQ